jgi:hypothetical protein
MMAIEALEPIAAASSEAIITSFRRTLAHPLKMTDGGKRAKDTTRLKKLSAAEGRRQCRTSNQIKW